MFSQSFMLGCLVGSTGKSAYLQARQLEFGSQCPRHRRDLTLTSCPLVSSNVSWNTDKQKLDKHKKYLK